MKRIIPPPADLFEQAWTSSTNAGPQDSFVFGDGVTTLSDQVPSDLLTSSFHFLDGKSHTSATPSLPADGDHFNFSATFDHDNDSGDEGAETPTYSAPSTATSFSSSTVEPHGIHSSDAVPVLSNNSAPQMEFANFFHVTPQPAFVGFHHGGDGPSEHAGRPLVLVNGDNELVVAPSGGANGGGGAGGGGTGGGGTVPAPIGTSASPFVINVIYDASVDSAPAGFKTAVNAAVQYLESQFTDAVTINISVGYGEVGGSALDGGALGESLTYLNSYSYSQVRTALLGDAKSADDTSATATLPLNAPVSGTYWVSTADAKALGLSGASTALDGYVGFAAGNLFDYDSSNGITANQYDFYGVFAHEVTEVMGRSLLVGQSIGSSAHGYYPLDLFHYSATGTRDFVGTQAGYFSLNGGATNLDNFNTNPGGDFGDWASSAGNDAFNAFGSPGVANAVTPTDIRVMDVIGWDHNSGSITPPPPSNTPLPPDLTVSGLALSGNTVSYHVNNGGTGAAAASTTGIYLSTDSTITSADTLIATTSAGSLAAGASDTESASLTWPSNLVAGTYYLGALADSSGQVTESNESNNASAVIPIILGNSANNVLTGTANADIMFGLAGNDTLNGAGGADRMSAGTGNDTYVVDDAGDLVVENPNEGTDTVQSSISYTLGANVENLTLTGSAAINGTGNGLNNAIVGNSANNALNGGLGNDQLTGGGGADQFVFNTAVKGTVNVDTITDFSHAASDMIDLDHLIFANLQTSAGHLAASDFFAGTSFTHTSAHILYNTITGALSYDADGAGHASPIQFALLTSHPALVANDFLIV